MTTPQLLQQAKQGDPDAIALLMNQSLEPKGIEAVVSRLGDRLHVGLTSAQPINQPLLTQFIENGIQNLNVDGIRSVDIDAVSSTSPGQAWQQTIELSPLAAPSAVPLSGESAPSGPAPSIPAPPPPPMVQPTPTTEGASAVYNTAPTAKTPVARAPIAEASADGPDPLDLSADAIEQDLALDTDDFMADIDQIADDVIRDVDLHEVTTKIESEIPFDVDDRDVDERNVDDPNMAFDSEGFPASFEPASTLEEQIFAGQVDPAIETAIQNHGLDELLDDELALPDAITEIDPESPPPASFDPTGASDVGYPVLAQPEPPSDSDGPWPTLGNIDGVGDDLSDDLYRDVEPLIELPEDEPMSTDNETTTDSGATDLAVASETAEADGDTATDSLSSESTDSDSPEKSTDDESTETANERPASKLLFALVFLLTVGSIAGLLGYALRPYAGNWRALFSPLDTQSAETAPSSEANEGGTEEPDTAEDPEGAEEGSVGDASAEDSPAVEADANNATNGSPADGTEEDEFPTSPTTPDDAEAAAPADGTSPAAADSEPSPTAAEPTNTGELALSAPSADQVSCPNILISTAQTLTISQVQMEPNATGDNGLYSIVGCLTNHTSAPITQATLRYQGQTSTGAADVGLSGLAFQSLAPKATVPFRVQLSVLETAEIIQVLGLDWQADGTNTQTLPLEFSLDLGS